MAKRRSGTSVEMTRRRFLLNTSLTSLATVVFGKAAAGLAATEETFPFANGERALVRYPQKRPLILLTARPPQLETPFGVFAEGLITPNDAFFVRYHLSQIPTTIDPDTFRLNVSGSVQSPLSLSLKDLRDSFEAVELVAVNQCSGNGRGFFNPRVAGGQLGNGAMGNARWRGVRLKAVLEHAGLRPGARQVSFNGLDTPVTEKVPDFVKALDVEQCLEEEILLAYEMNNEPLPMLNGFPLRLVVPGYFGTYWVKHLNEITVLEDAFKGYWMDPAYRIPDNSCACVEPGTTPKKSKPIARYNVRSFITSFSNNQTAVAGKEQTLQGFAFDGGYGITEVLVSEDGGRNWRKAELGKDLGKYSFRGWSLAFRPQRAGQMELMVKASNRIGQTQPLEPLWNPAGYMRNVVERVMVKVV